MKCKIKNHSDRKWLGRYVVCVVFLIIALFGPILYKDNLYMFIDIGADTYSGNWPTIVQALRWWKSGAHDFWNFQTGLGESIFISTDTLFDPFLLCLLPFDNPAQGIIFMMIAKYIVLAVFAYKLYQLLGLQSTPLIIASLCHVFSGFMIGWGQHYTFSTCFVLFTLLLFAFERYIHKGKWCLLTISTAILCCFFSYFAYMSLLFLAFWASGRFFQMKCGKNKKNFFRDFFKYVGTLGGIIVLGIMISFPAFLQQVELLLNTSRVSGDSTINFSIVSLENLQTFIERIFSNVLIGVNNTISEENFYEAPILYTGVLSIYGLIAYIGVKIKEREKKQIVFWMCLFFIIVFFPGAVNPLFNGLSDDTTRWYFVLVPIICYGSAKGLSQIILCGEKCKRISTVLGLCVIISFCIYYYTLRYPEFKADAELQLYAIIMISILGLGYGCIFVFMNNINKEYFYKVILCILCLDLGTNAVLSVYGRTIPRNVADGEYLYESTNYFDGTEDINKKISEQDDGFYRIAKTFNKIDLNSPAIQNYYGETFYKSFCSKYFADFIQAYGLREIDSNYFYGFDGKQDLRNLYGAKYLLSHIPMELPGYQLYDIINGTYVYLNNACVGLGVLYDSYITREEQLELQATEAESVLYDVCVLEEELPELTHMDSKQCFDTRLKEISFSTEIDASNNLLWIILDEYSDNSLQLEFECNTEAPLQIYYSSDGKLLEEKSFGTVIKANQQSWTIPEKHITRIAISAPNECINNISKISLYARKDTEILKKASVLQQEGLRVTEFSDSHICGEISCDKESMLVLSIPYNKGWKVRIDGVRSKILLANITFLGVVIPEGEHSVELVYEPNTFIIGRSCSFFAIILFGTLFIFLAKKEKSYVMRRQ